MAKIDPSMYLRNQETVRTPSPNLGKDEFLKILMVQLQNQDPLQPMDDKEFISQMTTFSSLEQMMNMANSIDQLVQNQSISPVVQYSHMIGKEVTYEVYDEDMDEITGEDTGKVVAVSQNEGLAVLELDNGEKVYADGVLQVKEPSVEANDENQSKEVDDTVDESTNNGNDETIGSS